jgi:23S rRNA (guanosine2251-2'-O)-methyltransferase
VSPAKRERKPPPTVLYGRNPVQEALRGRRVVREIWVTRSRPEYPGAKLVPPEKLDELAGSTEHQGVAAAVDPYPYADAEDLLVAEEGLIVVLDQVEDPHNLGAICRTAECAGALGVVIPDRRAAEVTAAVCKASAGAVEHLPVARVRNVADFLAAAREAGAWVYGADQEALTPHTEPDYRGRTVLVFGSEGKGLRPRVRDGCDALVAIPVRGLVGSLNVSAAAAVLIYEAVRGRGGA